MRISDWSSDVCSSDLFLRPTSGVVKFDGVEIQHWKPYRIARLGMCRTFQITLNPQHMTVMENMLLGAQHQIGENIVSAALRPAAVRRQEAENLERAWDLWGMVNLRPPSEDPARRLSGGTKKLHAIAP